jgi:3-phenylpropionate/trans-cinnamate dioxygenase ferredoxin component
MNYIKVAARAELPSNQVKKVVVEGHEILLANVNGSFYAIANRCTHLGGSLSNGNLEGTLIKCPRHGAQFDVTTGKAVGEAKLAFIKMKEKDEKCYLVKVEGEDILVGIE